MNKINLNWHSVPLSEVFLHTKSNKNGITSKEAKKRLKEHGHNILPKEKPYSKIRLFFSQFNSPLMYILLVTVTISFFLKHYTDTIFIIVVLFINTTVGFWQENKANNSLLALKQIVKVRARVLRDGYEKEIDSADLVQGDVVTLRPGDKVPADARIMESKGLRINESALTGEWIASDKKSDGSLAEKTIVSDRTNMVFMGTIVEEGQATIIVTATGAETQIGEVVLLIKKTKERKTPLQKKIFYLSGILGGIILSLIIIVIIEGYFTEKSFSEIFVAALALAVSAIPEGLLPAITVIMVFGMRRILKQKGLVRKLAATETLGSVTVICTDKTGTLTQGKMQVSHILTSTKELLSENINGILKGEKANGIESHISALKIAVLTNEAFVENPTSGLESWIIRGRPTEQALLLAGMQAGLNKRELEKNYPILDRISFDPEFKYAASLHKQNSKKNVLFVLGAPEKIISFSNYLDVDGKKTKLKKSDLDKLNKKLESLTEKGLRVVACAFKEYGPKTKYKNLSDLTTGLQLAGFIALKDPLRHDAKESIAITKKAGIRTIIITGDHRLTAKAVATEIGLDGEDRNIIEGSDLDKMDDEELKEAAKNVLIYARVSPRHKMQIIEALRANGEIVAMIGDGVNDAPALKYADIGVALGSGTDVAKESSDLVLLDNNFNTVVQAIEQGRIIFENIRKVLVYLVADDFSELFLFLSAMALGFPLPLLPAQILWINLVEDGFPDIALTTEQDTKGLMDEKPRNPKEPILNNPIKLWMAAIFVITGLAAFLSFFFIWKITGDIDKTRTIVFTLMCFDSLVFAFSVRSFKRTIFRKDIFSNRYLVLATGVGLILLLLAIYFSPLQALLHTQAIGAQGWLLICGVSLIEIILIEFFKKKIFK